jgi:hypothetical protein
LAIVLQAIIFAASPRIVPLPVDLGPDSICSFSGRSVEEFFMMHRPLLLSLLGISSLLGLLQAAAAKPQSLAQKLGDLRGVHQASFNHDGSRLVVRHRGNIGIWDASAGTQVTGDLGANTVSDTYVMSSDAKMFLVRFKGAVEGVRRRHGKSGFAHV